MADNPEEEEIPDRKFEITNEEENLVLEFRVLNRGELKNIMDATAYEPISGKRLHEVPFIICNDDTDGYQQIIAILIRQVLQLKEKIQLVKSTVKDL